MSVLILGGCQPKDVDFELDSLPVSERETEQPCKWWCWSVAIDHSLFGGASVVLLYHLDGEGFLRFDMDRLPHLQTR